MRGQSLEEYYTNIVYTVVDLVKESGEIKVDMEFEFVKVKMFELVNIRVVELLNDMGNKNASTLTRGLISLIPTKIDNKDELIEQLVEYHRAEKLAIRKFRHSDKKEVSLMSINEMFDLVVSNTQENVKIT